MKRKSELFPRGSMIIFIENDRVTPEKNEKLLRLIYDRGFSCYRAAEMLDISYQNAKAINRKEKIKIKEN